MTTYLEILAQIETLKQQAEVLRRDELAEVIADIRQKIRDYDLTAADLGLVAAQPATRPAATGKRPGAKPKYRNPDTGETWSGRGIMPRWLKAEVEAGRDRAAFLIAEG